MREQLAGVGSEDQAQVDRLGGLSPLWPDNKCYYLLSHLSGPDINQLNNQDSSSEQALYFLNSDS